MHPSAEQAIIPPGSIVDAGANTGEEACLLAYVGRGRIVHAVEPLWVNVNHMQRRSAGTELGRRLRPLLVGLGSSDGTLRVPATFNSLSNLTTGSAQINWSYKRTRTTVKLSGTRARWGQPAMHRTSSVPVYTLDTLFATHWRGERLGFAHLDLEWMELQVLQGAAATLARDRPVMTVEVWTHVKTGATRTVLRHLLQLGYDPYVVDEVAGVPLDVRNLLLLPHERNLTRAGASAAFDAAVKARLLLKVRSEADLFENVFPCCKQHAACCRNRATCCRNLKAVHRHEPTAAKLLGATAPGRDTLCEKDENCVISE